jgi:nitroimidazol reductase NimA-like FMN-containing flavoprotein (pyridoxamine 5'-phosphate oxidase superfamily)
MQDPITTIDLGHSGSPDAVATSWEETRRALETAEVFWLSTVRADGRPHVTPVSALWLDGSLYFQTGGIAQKSKHLRRSPHVTLTTGCNHLTTGFDIVVEGDAVPFTDVAVLERLNQMWSTLWGEGWPIEFRNGIFYETGGERKGEPLLVFSITPTKIFAYARGDQWSQTRYQF